MSQPPIFRLSTTAPETYVWDCSDWLGQDRIVTVEFVSDPDGLTLTNPESDDGMTASVEASGGIPGETYLLRNKIVTLGNRIDVRRILIAVGGGAVHSGPQTYNVPRDPSINCR